MGFQLIYKHLIKKSWWVILFSIFSFFLYHHISYKKQREIVELENRLLKLQKKTVIALREKEDLTLRLTSQSDPAWIEMILMKKLGVVPQGYVKVHFLKNEDPS